MSNRQKLYLGLAVSATVCTGVGLFLFYRHRREISLARNHRPISPVSVLPKFKQAPVSPSSSCSSTENENDEAEAIQLPNGSSIPTGGVPLSPDQAAILTGLLYQCNDDEEKLHQVLTSVANASSYRESQINLANADCITRLRELLLINGSETTKCKVLLALTNLALNDYAINHFTRIVAPVIDLCRNNPPRSCIRSYGLTLLINMSVSPHLHEEYMTNIYDLSALIESTLTCEEEALSSGKILVNLSKNRANSECLMKLTGLELKEILHLFQKSNNQDILLRYLTFYANVAENLVQEFSQPGDTNNNTAWFKDPEPQRQGALYFEYFDRDKQMAARNLLHPQYISPALDMQMQRLSQALELIGQYQVEASINAFENELND